MHTIDNWNILIYLGTKWIIQDGRTGHKMGNWSRKGYEEFLDFEVRFSKPHAKGRSDFFLRLKFGQPLLNLSNSLYHIFILSQIWTSLSHNLSHPNLDRTHSHLNFFSRTHARHAFLSNPHVLQSPTLSHTSHFLHAPSSLTFHVHMSFLSQSPTRSLSPQLPQRSQQSPTHSLSS